MERKTFSIVKMSVLTILLVWATACVCLADAASDLEQGKSLYRADNFNSAIDCFDKILTDYSGSEAAAECNYWLGFCYIGKQDQDQAMIKFQAQVSQYPSNQKSPRAACEIGNIYQARKQYDQALAQFNKALVDYPEHALAARFHIGGCYQEQRKYAEAIEAYNAAISSAPPDTPKDDFYLQYSRYSLGDCYREIKDWDTAIATYTQLIEDYPNDAGPQKINLASCYQGKKDYERAIALYQEVAVEYPNEEGVALLAVDDCLGEQRKHDEKLAYLNKLYNEHPDLRPEILFRRGILLGEIMWEATESITDLERIVNEYPDHMRVVEAKARIAHITVHRLKDNTNARILLEQFIAEYPDYEFMMFVKLDLATCDYAERNWLRAAQSYEETLQYEDPSNYHAATLDIIADCYKRLGDIEKAKEALKKLIDTYPGDCWAVQAAKEYAALCQPVGGGNK